MSEGVAAVMNRINRIRSAFGSGSGGLLGVQQANTTGFDLALRSASRSSGPSAARSTSKASASGPDPLDRIGVTGGTKKGSGSSKGLGEDTTGWPEGVPEEALEYRDAYLAASQATGVPLPILLAVSWAESAFQPGAESGAGAQGLMQLMPATAAGLGVDPTDPAQNIMGGARYLAAQYEAFGSWDLAFAAYNAGPGAVEQYGGIPPYDETRNYISVINSYLERITPAPGQVGALQAQAAQPGVLDAAFGTGGAPGALDADAAARAAGGAQSSPIATLEGPFGSLDRHPLEGNGAAGAATGPTLERLAAAQSPTGATTPSGTSTMTANAAVLPERVAALVQQTKSNGQSTHKLTLRLDPPDLGTVNVTFELRGDQVHMVVRPERAESGQLLNQQRDRIAAALANEGFELSGFDVGTSAGDQSGHARQGAAARGQYRPIDLEPTTHVALTVDRELRL